MKKLFTKLLSVALVTMTVGQAVAEINPYLGGAPASGKKLSEVFRETYPDAPILPQSMDQWVLGHPVKVFAIAAGVGVAMYAAYKTYGLVHAKLFPRSAFGQKIKQLAAKKKYQKARQAIADVAGVNTGVISYTEKNELLALLNSNPVSLKAFNAYVNETFMKSGRIMSLAKTIAGGALAYYVLPKLIARYLRR